MSLQDERQILKEIHDVKKSKNSVEEYTKGDEKIQGLKAELNKMRDTVKLEIKSISEIEVALSKVKLANKLGCTTQDLTTIEVDCPADKMGKVIGKNGSTVKQIEESTRVTIEIRKDDNKVAITGSASSIAAAAAEIDKIVQSTEEVFSIDDKILKYVTARQISVLDDLKKQYEDVYLDVLRNNEKVILRGMPDRVNAVKSSLLGMQIVSKEISLTRREAAIVIGEKGSTVDKLLESHNVCIDVEKIDDIKSTAVVLGPTNQVTSALKEIDELLSENSEAVETIAIDVMMKRILLAENGNHAKTIQKSVNDKMKEKGLDANVLVSINKEKSIEKDHPILQVKTKNACLEAAVQLAKNEIKDLQPLILSLDVDQVVIPKIIGRSGETLKKICGDDGFIDIDREARRIVVGSTTAERRDSILEALNAIIAQNRILRVDYDPSLIKMQFKELIRSNVKAQMTEVGCWIEIDEEKGQFVFRGSDENNGKCRDILLEFLESNYLREMSITQEDKDSLLAGGKGSKLEKISEEEGVKLSVDKESFVLIARGTKEKVVSAMDKLDQFLKGGNGHSVSRLSVSEQIVGVIVGKGGKTRQQLEEKYSGVAIHISKCHNVTIRGPENQVAACRVEVLKLIASARVTQTVPVSDVQQKTLEKNGMLRKITQTASVQIQISGGAAQIKGLFYDVCDAVSLLNEQLTGVYQSVIELDALQFSKIRAAARDPSHFQRIKDSTRATVSLDLSSGSVTVGGTRNDVKKAKDQLFGFFEFIIPGKITRLKIPKPLQYSVGRGMALAEISAESGGATVYLDRDLNSIIIRSTDPKKVESATSLMKEKIVGDEKLVGVIEVDPSESSFIFSSIIGPKGSRIKAIQKESDCHIEVSRESETITITGQTEGGVAKAKETIAGLIEKARKENAFVSIPEAAIPAFCGKGGSKVKEFSAAHGVEMLRERKGPYTFKISGPEDSCENAKTALAEWLKKWEESTGTMTTSVEKPDIPVILGSKGDTVRAIQEEFGCRINVDRRGLSVTVKSGTAESRQKTMEKIKALIAEAREEAAAARKARSASEDESADLTDEPTSKAGRSYSTDSGSVEEIKVADARLYPTRPVGLTTTPPKQTHNHHAKKSGDLGVQEGTQAGKNLFQLLVSD
jgi:polyribonucleotide nucleotidyltransferase